MPFSFVACKGRKELCDFGNLKLVGRLVKVHYNLTGGVQSVLAKEILFVGARETPGLNRQGSRGVLASCVEGDISWLLSVAGPCASQPRAPCRLGPSAAQQEAGRGALVLPGRREGLYLGDVATALKCRLPHAFLPN